ncbi:ADP-ribosylglycohydrolase family protein [Pseudactinotalea suaedae]|uniref:ADP-ribosylglycohydrolase family protein n=1 Tax=Pseudactinotalea suaedae TaxID=1524924 RepID=UPI0012E1E99A|nr:ADP-ribosylglycohydrolase family protein [Pseudactinotalea suaedae]
MRLTWAQPEDLVAAELVALTEQGADAEALAAVRQRWVEAGGSPVLQPSGASAEPAPASLRALARDLLDELATLQPTDPAEPDGWDEIAALLPPAPVLPQRTSLDRVSGAWTGRAAGCLLGKPVEKIPRQGIEEILRATGRWPLDDWFTAVGLPDDVAARWPWNRRSAPTSLAENIDGMPEDDDLNFPMLALDLLEQHGEALTTDDIAQGWLGALPAGRVFTAERAAYRNLLDARPVPETATHHNPFREWIGALIRADVLGWAHPGDVRAAARLAWVDARLSHTRNGIYGELWAAALCAASLVADDVTQVLDAGSAVVPPGSRLAAAIALGRELGASGREQADALDVLHAELGHLHWVHTLNNAALIAYALESGQGELGPSVATAVVGGWDTDSAGATVGAVVGGLRGSAALPARWTEPLRGVIATSLPGPAEREIADLAGRTLALSGGREGQR